MPPRLVLPPDFETRYTEGERELILAHERAHLARGDTFANALAALLRGLFWFHPLVHYAIARFRQDQELACDAAVLRRFPQARRSYAEAMLKTQLAVLGLPVGCHWQSSHPLKERIAMLKHPIPHPARRALGFGLAAMLALFGGYAAWAAQPAQLKGQPKAETQQSIQAVFEQRIDSGPAHTFTVINPLGQPFAFRNDEGDHWEGEFVVTAAGVGKWQMAGTLKRNGKVMSEPTLIVDDGVEGRILVGTAAGEHLEGLDLRVTLTATAAEKSPQPASAHAKVADSDKPVTGNVGATEDLAYREQHPPQYPRELIKRRISGEVVLRVQVHADGTPGQVLRERAEAHARPAEAAAYTREQGDADVTTLVEASTRAVREWRFRPAQSGGKAIEDWVLVPFTYALSER
jgi:hypothetical protein